MTYQGSSMGGFVGNYESLTDLTAKRPPSNYAGRQATIGTPSTQSTTYICDGTSWQPAAVFDLDASGNVTGLVGPNSEVVALSEVTPYVNMTATGTAFSGACEFAGYVCTVAAGNITIYDNTSAAGTVIVPTTALSVGASPIFGAGTNGRMALTTGCHVVLSGAATVNVLVG